MTEQEIMTCAQAGRKACVDAIGRSFFEKHKDKSVFAHDGELFDERGIYCFLGVNTTEKQYDGLRLDANLDDWEYYASCYSLIGSITMSQCRLPDE